ncbi:signal peptidase I [Winogradskyella sp. A3E31]|uniref:signal peptidase I n=1 Tax=Winogradskyella sp. A3E31 TaxID=3349637 RepID=UPI00398B85CA
MKKKVILVILVLIGLHFLFKELGLLRVYNIPSSSSEPNLKEGSTIIGTSLKSPERLDFAYFKFSDSLRGWTIVKRLIAIPGDTLECKNGNYIVNNKKIDKHLNLRFAYKILPNVFDLYVKEQINYAEYYKYIDSDSVTAFLDNSFVEKLPIKLDRKYDDETRNLSIEIFNENPNWTLNNFGPIILPKEKYFFSGDSRDNSIDSRYRGFVDEENILGTVLMNF